VSKPDIYLDPQDIRDIIFVSFAAFADVIEPEALARVTSFMRGMADSPRRAPAAAQAIRQLADIMDNIEPPEPAPDPRSRFKLIDGGGGTAA
jgi:hypothetical protein